MHWNYLNSKSVKLVAVYMDSVIYYFRLAKSIKNKHLTDA